MADLNRTSLPVMRGQYQPGPIVQAGSVDIEALQSQINDITDRLDALEAQAADFETRIAALEP